MNTALLSYLDVLWRRNDGMAAVIAAAEAQASEPWKVVRDAGLLARCRVDQAPRDLGLTANLQTRTPNGTGVIARVPKGAPYPVLHHVGRRNRGAYDTPIDMARRVVGGARQAAEGRVMVGLDTACGTGAFLVAMDEAGIPEIHGSDIDEAALAVAHIAVPRAKLVVADALDHGPAVDLVVGNPPFVPPERQDPLLRAKLRLRFPWLHGRFDLVVPFAAVAVDRVRPRGGVGLVLPAPAMVQPYGAVLRRRWVERHRITTLAGPEPFPGAAVEVMLVVLRTADGPAPVPLFGVPPEELLRLETVPLNPWLRPGDVPLVERIRSKSVELREMALVDTGVVAHSPGGSREDLLYDEPGGNRVPYADAKDYFAGKRRWLDYKPERMHRAKRPEMFEDTKIIVQRIMGDGLVKAAIDDDGVFVGHTCTVVCPYDERVPIERLLELITSELVIGVTRIERGRRLDLYPRDVGRFPVPLAWLTDSSIPLEKAWGLVGDDVHRLLNLAD